MSPPDENSADGSRKYSEANLICWQQTGSASQTHTLHRLRGSTHGGVERYALSVLPEIRPAHLADAALIARMSRSLIERGLPWRWTPKAVAPHIRDSETAVVVAWADDRMLGFAIMGFRFLRSEPHLLLLAVDPAARRNREAVQSGSDLGRLARGLLRAGS